CIRIPNTLGYRRRFDMRCVTYSRVSKDDGSQTNLNQTPLLREFAQRLGHDVVAHYMDEESGATHDRAGLIALLQGAARREFDFVVFKCIDRVSRAGAYWAHAFFLVSVPPLLSSPTSDCFQFPRQS